MPWEERIRFRQARTCFFELKCEEITTGKGVAQDYAETAKWWRLAAEQGYAPAQFGMAILYQNGIHVNRDGREALRWGLRAAEQGHAMAQLRLGYLYSQGNRELGMDRDFVQAHLWYSLAAERLPGELREAAEDLADQLEWEMSFSERAEAQRMAREWKPRSH